MPYYDPDIDNPGRHSETDKLDICCYNRKVFRCMRRWNCEPRYFFSCENLAASIAFIGSVLVMGFGVHNYLFQNNAVNYYAPTTLIPILTKTVIPQITSTHNCTFNQDFNFTSLLPSCEIISATGSCFETTCTDYAQQCYPCTYACYTTSCWIPTQQPACVNLMNNYNCTMYYEQKMTTYSCDAYHADAVALCNQTCPYLSCASYNPTCHCVNLNCLNKKNAICDYVFTTKNATKLRVQYSYEIKNTTYFADNFTTGNIQIINGHISTSCYSGDCIDNFISNHSLPITAYYPFSDYTNLLADTPSNVTPDIVAMVTMGVLMTVYFGILAIGVWCLTFCCCRIPRAPKQVPKQAPKQVKSTQIQVTQMTQVKNQLPEHKMTIHATNVTCTICQQQLMTHDMKVLKCTHIFHKDCIDKQTSCSLCPPVNI